MAAQARTLLLSLAAFCLPAFANVPRTTLVAEKPLQGVEGFVLASHRGPATANALIATGIARCLCDEGRRSRSTGKERDAETGLDYFGARYMASAQGRFTSPDAPLIDQHPGNPQSWNLYAYVRNNPLRFVDPTGQGCFVSSDGTQTSDRPGSPMLNNSDCAIANRTDQTIGRTEVIGNDVPLSDTARAILTSAAGLAEGPVNVLGVPLVIFLNAAVPGSFSSAVPAAAGALMPAAGIATPGGVAVQSGAGAALAMRTEVEAGANLYRVGTTGQSNTSAAQYWSLQNPVSTPNFAGSLGIPAENVANQNFMVTGTLRPGSPFVVRPAPGVGANAGGALEVVVQPGGVKLRSFISK